MTVEFRPGRQAASEWLLNTFGIETKIQGKSHWSSLEGHVGEENAGALLLGLEHLDYIDPLTLYDVVPDQSAFYTVVLQKGFRYGGGWIRELLSQLFMRTVAINNTDEHHSLNHDVPKIADLTKRPNHVVAWYPSGTRNPTANLRSHFAAVSQKPDIHTYPFVSLTDGPALFASKSSVLTNLGSFASGFLPHPSRETVTYYNLLLPPLDSDDIKSMREGKNARAGNSMVTKKFEVIRAIALQKLLNMHPELEETNAQNAAVTHWLNEIPDHIRHMNSVRWDHHLAWLDTNGYLSYLGLEA